MTELTGQQKTKLKVLAHHLNPVIYVGQKGVSPSLIEATEKALGDHELIKLKFVDFKDEKTHLLRQVIDLTGASLVNTIGNIAVLYRENPELDVAGKIKI